LSTEHPYGYIKNDKVFLSSWGPHEEREIGLVKDDNPQSAIDFFEEKFSRLENEVSKIEEQVSNDTNKGSYLMKLTHLLEKLPEHNGLGDYEAIEGRITILLHEIKDWIQKNREKNLELKNKLLEDLKGAVEIVHWKEATDKVLEIKNQWIRTGNTEENQEKELESKFQLLIQDFFDRKKSFYEDKRRLASHYEEVYKELIEAAQKLKELDWNLRKSQIADLKEKWSDNGSIPSELYKPLRDQFNRAIKAAFHRPESKNDLEGILKKLNEMNMNYAGVTKNDLKTVFNQLRKVPANSQREKKSRSLAYELYQTVNEKSFVYQTCLRKHPGFSEKPLAEKKRLMLQVLRELRDRDQKELETIRSNRENFQTQNLDLNQLIQKKIHNQEMKILVKERIMEELKLQS
jgi:hypothetical protein